MDMIIKEIELGEIDGEIGIIAMKGGFKIKGDKDEGIYL